jgi:hypothetical protein
MQYSVLHMATMQYSVLHCASNYSTVQAATHMGNPTLEQKDKLCVMLLIQQLLSLAALCCAQAVAASGPSPVTAPI